MHLLSPWDDDRNVWAKKNYLAWMDALGLDPMH
jgi:hypothetical protein